jgi:hypothetical protein
MQLDVLGSGLLDTDRVRVCVEDVMIHETTVGHGKIAVSGLPDSDPLNVTINGLDGPLRSGQTVPTALGLDVPWALVNWEACTDNCLPCTIEKVSDDSADNAGRLLTIHFID